MGALRNFSSPPHLSESKKCQQSPKQSDYFITGFAEPQEIETLLKHLFPDRLGLLFLK